MAGCAQCMGNVNGSQCEWCAGHEAGCAESKAELEKLKLILNASINALQRIKNQSNNGFHAMREASTAIDEIEAMMLPNDPKQP